VLGNLYFPEETFKRYCMSYHQTEQNSANSYDERFYSENLADERVSARAIVKAVTSFIKPKTVIDVGCGSGLIGHTFLQYGAEETFGMDGDYIDRKHLQLDAEHFIPCDLTKPVHSERRYDMALTLEVAEHLAEQYAEQFVTSLCSLSDVVVFSAAVPGQGGVQHINEQPQSYWAALFEKNGYRAVDCIRPLLWDDKNVSDWYKNNIILYVSKSCNRWNKLNSYVQTPIFDTIHPDMFSLIMGLDKYKGELL
jgi:hypothetical protein